MCGDLPATEFTELHVQSLCLAWKARLSRASRYIRTMRLKRLLRSIAALTARPDLLHAIIRVRPPGPRQTIATPEEIRSLLAKAKPWMQVIILLATHAGLRRSDCLGAAPVHYNSESRTLTIDQKKPEG